MSGPWAEDGRLTPLTEADRERIADHERRIAEALAGRRAAEGGDSMPNPTGGEDWHSQDDPPPREPKPTNPSK